MRKSLSVLTDHKKLMIERLLYLNGKGFLRNKEYVDQYKKMYEKSNQLIFLYLKYEIKGGEKYIKKICDGIEELCTNEKDCINSMINNWKF